MSANRFISEVRNCDFMYMISTNYTNLPYISCNNENCDDLVYVFFDLKAANEKNDILVREVFNTKVDTIPKKDIIISLGKLINLGVNAICSIYSDGTEDIIQLSDLIKEDEDKISEIAKITNPTLSLTILYFMQAYRKLMYVKNANDKELANISKDVIDEVNDEQYNKVLKDLEEEMLINFIRSKVLMPILKTDDGSINMLMVNRNSDSKSYIPLFTDINAMDLLDKNEKTGVSVVDFERIRNMQLPKEANGFVINMYGPAVIISSEWLNNVKKG